MQEVLSPSFNNFEQNNEANFLIFHNIEKRVRHHRDLARWPLHITVVPPFKLEAGLAGTNKLRELVREVAQDFRPFYVSAKEDVLFGPNNTEPATIIEDTSGVLHALHDRFLWDLGSIGCKEIDMTYGGEKYTPHYTWKRGVFPPVRTFTCDTLSIAMKRGGSKQMLDTHLLLD